MDLGEPRFPDGSPVLRPCVLVSTIGGRHPYKAVVDSGSPLSVANPEFLAASGIDVDTTMPMMEFDGSYSTVQVRESRQRVDAVGSRMLRVRASGS